ncbi:MAG: purine-nucleoside phosphorylase [Lutisporaceae bacterium]
MKYIDKINQASEYIKNRISIEPEIGIILGTGLGSLAEHIENSTVIEYSDIPEFPVSTVAGHAGKMIIGTLEGKNVIAMQGRFHYYEGYSMQEVTLPVRVMKMLGIKLLIASNACGGLNPVFNAGDIMTITDHINMMGANPLIGANLDEFGPRFPDMSEVYNKEYIKLLHEIAEKLNIKLQKGVYCAISGPNYLSKAELRMLISIGADTVGMSTVPECVVARHSGLKVLGVSCITDMAIPDSMTSPTHEEIMKVAEGIKPKFVSLLKQFIKEVQL